MHAVTRVTAAWDRFVASDPGLIRLMSALRTVLSIGLALLVMTALGVPVMLLVAGAMAAMVSSFAISETLLRDQAITLAAGLPTALAAVSLGTLLAPYRAAADIVFLLLIFGAVYIRRYGRRAQALGLMAFQLFFVSQFIRAQTAQLPQLYEVMAVAFGSGAVVRFVLLRATPEWTLRRLLHAFRGRLSRAVGTLAVLSELQRDAGPQHRAGSRHRAGEHSPRRRAERDVRKRIASLHECAVMIQGRIDDAVPDESAAAALQRRVAESDVAAQRLAALLLGHSSGTHRLGEALEELRLILEREGPEGRDEATALARERLLSVREDVADAPPEAVETLRAAGELAFAMFGVRVAAGQEEETPGPAGRRGSAVPSAAESRPRARWGMLVLDRDHGVRALPADPGGAPPRGPEAAPRPPAGAAPAGDGPGPGRGAVESSREELAVEDLSLGLRVTMGRETDTGRQVGLRRPTTRAAFQVTVGSALAIVGGEFLSAQRWYWAVLTCWVVFLNTASTGEILVKGYRRLIGTIVGVVAGVGVTTLVAGDVPLAFALVLVCVFCMFFTAPLSYALMSFFVTNMLGLLYTLLHTYSVSVMVLRIEETLLGAASGLIAALVVLPVRTGAHTDQRLADVVEALRETVQASLSRLEGGRGLEDPALDDSVRDLDEAVENLRQATAPLTHPVSPLRVRRGTTRYVVGLINGAAYHARALASCVQQLPESGAEDDTARRLADQVTEHLTRLGDHLSGTRRGTRPAGSRIYRTVPYAEAGVPLAAAPRADPGTALGPGRTARVRRHLQRLEENVRGLDEPLHLGGDEPARDGSGPGPA
ncbi:FUSC family protein [Streptomyces sp. NPDC059740]|uniref:FUSC family protein n=1 Tax=Streptomyces sp. NPDC059740 TaxID=3346926 RepID=UPI00366510B5